MSEEAEEPKTESPRKPAAASQKRELEQAPLMLRKASWILVAGAMFPFFSALRYAAAAVNKHGGLSTSHGFRCIQEQLGRDPWFKMIEDTPGQNPA